MWDGRESSERWKEGGSEMRVGGMECGMGGGRMCGREGR